MSTDHNEKEEFCKKLWIDNKDTLTQMCKYKLSNYPDEVDDVISETFYYLCSTIFSGKVLTNPKAWLFVVANNLIKKKYQEINNLKQKQVSYNEQIYEIQINKKIDIEDLIISESMIEQLSDIVINELNPEEKILYEYIYNQKLKIKEIASILGLTEVNVRQKKHRLNKKLNGLIKSYIEEEVKY